MLAKDKCFTEEDREFILKTMEFDPRDRQLRGSCWRISGLRVCHNGRSGATISFKHMLEDSGSLSLATVYCQQRMRFTRSSSTVDNVSDRSYNCHLILISYQ